MTLAWPLHSERQIIPLHVIHAYGKSAGRPALGGWGEWCRGPGGRVQGAEELIFEMKKSISCVLEILNCSDI